MRCGWVIAALLVLSGTAGAERPPRLEEALAKAAAANKPLVVEFYAEWCKPCKWFDANVLSRSDVQAALKTVEYVRYDIDDTPGDLVASRYDVTGVPTFLVFDRSGGLANRQSGVRPTNAHQWFIDLLAGAVGTTQSTARLETAVAESPSDAKRRLALAQLYRKLGRQDEALKQLRLIIEQPAVPRDVAAEATAERDAIEGAEIRLTQALEAAERFVDEFPDSHLSSMRLLILAQSGRVSRDRVHVLASHHLEAVSLADWPYAVRAVLAAGHAQVAGKSIQQRVFDNPGNTSVTLMRAEELFLKGNREDGAKWTEEICGKAHAGFELWCFLLQQRGRGDRNDHRRLSALREQAQHFIDDVTDPGDHSHEVSLENVGDLDEKFGNAISIALERARVECGHLATPPSFAMIGLKFATRDIEIFTRDGKTLNRCIERVIRGAWNSFPTPAPELGDHMHGVIVFHMPSDREPGYPAPSYAAALPQLVVRRGAIETYGFRGDFRFGRGDSRRWRRRFQWNAGGTLEIAGADSGKPAYVARAGVGFETAWSRSMEASFLLAPEIRDLGTDAPRAFLVTLEDRLRIAVGSTRLHLWGSFGWSRVERESSYGVGISFPIDTWRIFLGAAYESRVAGENAMFTFGLPVGEVY